MSKLRVMCAGAILLLGTVLYATTLERLSLAAMSRQSTAIVHARVLGSTNLARGDAAFTVYRLEVIERWKTGKAAAPVEVAVPGGVVRGTRQMVAGAPSLQFSREYVFFLWTSPRGLTQIMGLSQGLFPVRREGGMDIVTRAASSERMIDTAGQPVRDEELRMKLSDLKSQVAHSIEGSD